MATLKQRKVMQKISEILRSPEISISYGALLKECGYSDSVSKKPKSVLTSKNIRQLEKVYFGESSESVYKELLFLINQQSNLSAKARGIDLYYRLTGAYYQKSHKPTCEIADSTVEKIGNLLP
jgi:hypothetical protein